MNLHLHRGGQQYGPYTLEAFQEMVRQGNSTVDDLVWPEGAAGWIPAAEFLASQQAAPAAAAAGLRVSSAPPVATPAYVPAAARPAVARPMAQRPARSGGSSSTGKLVTRIAIGLGVALVMFVAARFAMGFYKAMTAPKGPPAPGQAEFESASNKISVKGDSVAYGNSPKAVEIAAEFSKLMKTLRQAFFEGGKKNGFSVSDHQFLTYCELRDDKCVILVHVPELRRFATDAKKDLGELAWVTACSVLEDKVAPPRPNRLTARPLVRRPGQPLAPAPPPEPPREFKVAVALRGVLWYDRVLAGRSVVGTGPQLGKNFTLTEGDDAKSLLYPFFAADEPKPAPDSTASAGATNGPRTSVNSTNRAKPAGTR